MKAKVLIIGAGGRGDAVISLLAGSADIQIEGVVDNDSEAEGMKLARTLGIPVFTRVETALENKEIRYVINITGDDALQRELLGIVPAGVEVIGGQSAQFVRGIVEAYSKTAEGLKKSQERFQVVMDSLDALVYVADMDTYELLFVNKFGMERWGAAVGRYCWQALQRDQNGPCQFCTNARLIDAQGNPAGVLVWESGKSSDGKWYQCRDQAIRWIDGRLVRLEVAVEITANKRMQTQLHDKIHELERFQKLVVGRELKMRELKNRIRELESGPEKR